MVMDEEGNVAGKGANHEQQWQNFGFSAVALDVEHVVGSQHKNDGC